MSKNLLIIVVLLLIVVGIAYFTYNNLKSTDNNTLNINGEKIELEIADTPEEQSKGLSGKVNLKSNKGMLFIFPKAEKHTFWMKDMRFPIDIIFINGEKIVTIYKKVEPQLEKTANYTIYTPTTPADKVLELNAGKSDELGLKVNGTIDLPN